jgi:hypothetical protein
MGINKIKQAAAIAKTRTNDKRWIAAIEKAVAGVESGWIVTELAHGIAVTTENGTYFANGACQCKAFSNGQACKHRALARLLEIAGEIKEAAGAASSRATVIAEITNMWPKTWPPIYTELLARFGVSSLRMLDDDSLRRVRLSVAM